MLSQATRDDLVARHSESHRRYHTQAHIDDCLAQVAASDDLSVDERTLLEAALWFHDAIYDPVRPDNEARSADLATELLTHEGADPAFIAEVHRLILLTAGHEVAPGDRMGARLVSIDLSILGASPDRYRAYTQAIREEYAHVPEPLYRMSRAAIMKRFLASPVLFPDPAWADRLDTQSRTNIAEEIAALEA